LTLAELIRSTERRFRAARLFYGHGTTNARDEAAFLVLRALRLPFDAPLSREVTPPQGKKIESLLRRRIEERIPVPYLLNEAWLADRVFYVDRRVIIPRSHIAELLEARLRPWLARAPRRVLDLCTGSACLAILAAHAFTQAKVDASDLSKDALAVARKNVAKHRLGKRVRLIRSDLFAALPRERYDLIVTNPPYVAAAAMRKLPPEYRHEPGTALAGGADGLHLVKRIVREAQGRLKDGGVLVCEIGDGRKALERACPGLDFTWPETAAGTGPVFVLRAPFRLRNRIAEAESPTL
jgi:ribosomal protein L3 glutamine methyltransferase